MERKTLDIQLFEENMRFKQGERIFPMIKRIEMLMAFADAARIHNDLTIRPYAEEIIKLFDLYDND